MRCTPKNDTHINPAEIVYGTSLKLPGEFFTPSSVQLTEPEFLKDLKRIMSKISPIPVSHKDNSKIFIHPDLDKSSQVFIRNDNVRSPLTAPYDGPYEVLQKFDKYYEVQINGKSKRISLDRLKPAFLTTEVELTTKLPYITRSGRKVIIPARY